MAVKLHAVPFNRDPDQSLDSGRNCTPLSAQALRTSSKENGGGFIYYIFLRCLANNHRCLGPLQAMAVSLFTKKFRWGAVAKRKENVVGRGCFSEEFVGNVYVETYISKNLDCYLQDAKQPEWCVSRFCLASSLTTELIVTGLMHKQAVDAACHIPSTLQLWR
jgi:hypothetical protein